MILRSLCVRCPVQSGSARRREASPVAARSWDIMVVEKLLVRGAASKYEMTASTP